jgi:hypothetical protein
VRSVSLPGLAKPSQDCDHRWALRPWEPLRYSWSQRSRGWHEGGAAFGRGDDPVLWGRQFACLSFGVDKSPSLSFC